MNPFQSISGILLCVVIITGAACSKKNASTSTLQPDQVSITRDQPYGDDPSQVMDIYLPVDRDPNKTKTLVLVHGGAWSGGDKKDYNRAIDSLLTLTHDYACFNINYRLSKNGRNQYPAALEDLQKALDYVWQNSSRFKVSQVTVVLGTSAGAHLAALQAYRHNDKGLIKAVVCLMGVYDMTTYYSQAQLLYKGFLINFMGGTPGQKPAVYSDASPVKYITNRSIPTFVMHGTEDKVAPPAQAREVVEKLESAGVPHQYHTYAGGHSIPASADVLPKVVKFLKDYVEK